MSLRREHRQLQLLKEQILQINIQLKVQLKEDFSKKKKKNV
jgi:hypothetical protein